MRVGAITRLSRLPDFLWQLIDLANEETWLTTAGREIKIGRHGYHIKILIEVHLKTLGRVQDQLIKVDRFDLETVIKIQTT